MTLPDFLYGTAWKEERTPSLTASSLEHPGTDYVDSYVRHGSASGYGWTDEVRTIESLAD